MRFRRRATGRVTELLSTTAFNFGPLEGRARAEENADVAMRVYKASRESILSTCAVEIGEESRVRSLGKVRRSSSSLLYSLSQGPPLFVL